MIKDNQKDVDVFHEANDYMTTFKIVSHLEPSEMDSIYLTIKEVIRQKGLKTKLINNKSIDQYERYESFELIRIKNFDESKVLNVIKKIMYCEYGATMEKIGMKTRIADIIVSRDIFYFLVRKYTKRSQKAAALLLPLKHHHSTIVNVEQKCAHAIKYKTELGDKLVEASNLVRSLLY